jgi:hypothetical protein
MKSDNLQISLNAINDQAESEGRSVVICRLTTSYWHDRNGIYSTRKLKFLHRKCKSFNFVQEDADCIGADECWQRIINIAECKDGIYQVLTCNESRDYETGIIDDYDFRLVPLD